MAGKGQLNDRGSVNIVSTLVAMVIFGIFITGVLAQYARGAASSLQARSHAEGVAVLAWKASEYRSNGCPDVSTTTIPPVTTLGPDDLATIGGFGVTCIEIDRCWPPLPTGGPPPRPNVGPPASCPEPHELVQSRDITVSWGKADSAGRTLKHTIIGQ